MEVRFVGVVILVGRGRRTPLRTGVVRGLRLLAVTAELVLRLPVVFGPLPPPLTLPAPPAVP